MTPNRISASARSLTWLLIAAFVAASLPAPAFAQDLAAGDPPAPQDDSGAPPPPSEGEGQPPPPPPGEEGQMPPAGQRRPPRSGLRASPPPRGGFAPSGPSAPDGAGASEMETSVSDSGEKLYQLNLKDAPLDVLLDRYSELTGRTMIKAPGIAATFTFKAQDKLTHAEMIQAMDSLLTMSKITLVPLGTRFYRVVQTDQAPAEGMAIQREAPEGGPPESDALVSQMINLKYLEMEDAVNVVKELLHGYGKAQRFDRINSLLVTETSANLKRIYEILELVDQPTETRIETRVYEIQHAKASDIAARLNELVSDSQGEKKEEVAQVAQPGTALGRRTPSNIRARQPAAAPEPDTAAALEAAMAERGIVSGKVKVLADERTNIIIVISRPSNFVFFDKIVAVLDRPVNPEVIVEVFALEFADAEEVASLLNDFIGVAKADATAAPQTGDAAASTDSRARALEELVRARAAASDRTKASAETTGKIGQLSPNTKILADKRTNTLLLMGTKGDIAELQGVIKKVDIMLAQVLIEAVILEVSLNNTTTYGVNWLQKSMTSYSQKTVNGVSVRDPVASWGGNFGENKFSTAAGDTITRAFGGGSGLSYFFTFADLNLDAVLSMAASSGEARVLSTPVILTTDNTEANIMSGQQIPVRTGDTDSGGTVRSDYEYKDVGVELTVKPRINPSRYVTLEITQTADTLGDPVEVGSGDTMYSINKREMKAQLSVPSRSTVVLGGLVQTDYSASDARVPILGSIPLLGALFRSDNTTRKRTELLVLLTPYVLITPDEARSETERLHRASNVAAEDWYRGWSDSPLAPFSPSDLRQMKKAAKAESRRAHVKTPAGESEKSAPPVAVIAPAAAMPKPTPDAMDPEAFGRELEETMKAQAEASSAESPGTAESPASVPGSPLPAPAEATTTAPFVFDPAVSAAPEAAPEPAPEPKAKRKPRQALLKSSKKDEPKPSMFPAPSPEAEETNGGTP
ncbi:MAG: type II secretion system secretin GspD [Kiritimatiellia bacterium]